MWGQVVLQVLLCLSNLSKQLFQYHSSEGFKSSMNQLVIGSVLRDYMYILFPLSFSETLT